MGLGETDKAIKEQPGKSLTVLQGLWAGAAAFVAGQAPPSHDREKLERQEALF